MLCTRRRKIEAVLRIRPRFGAWLLIAPAVTRPFSTGLGVAGGIAADITAAASAAATPASAATTTLAAISAISTLIPRAFGCLRLRRGFGLRR